MNRAQARERIIEQHDDLRERMRRCKALADRLLAGAPVAPLLDAELGGLRAAFHAHNDSEERLLEPLLRDRDDWSPQRIARMLEEHVDEHGVLRAMLLGSAVEVAVRMNDIIEDLDAHMAAEERTFLSPQVLRD